MRMVTLPGGEEVASLGQGTWMMGEQAGRRADEIAALRTGIDLGMTLIDTAEMYGDGLTETLVGEAIGDVREHVFLVSKAYPWNASRDRLEAACDASLARLRTDRIDLYLLHWQGRVPFAETVGAMQKLQRAGKIRHWGVSNLDTPEMAELAAIGDVGCVTDQVLYNLTRRGPERDLLPWLAKHGMAVMAYSPVEQGRLIDNRQLCEIAASLGMRSAQLALAWVLRRPGMITIPKAGTVAHVHDNRASADVVLATEILDRLEEIFPAPRERVPLEML